MIYQLLMDCVVQMHKEAGQEDDPAIARTLRNFADVLSSVAKVLKALSL